MDAMDGPIEDRLTLYHDAIADFADTSFDFDPTADVPIAGLAPTDGGGGAYGGGGCRLGDRPLWAIHRTRTELIRLFGRWGALERALTDPSGDDEPDDSPPRKG